MKSQFDFNKFHRINIVKILLSFIAGMLFGWFLSSTSRTITDYEVDNLKNNIDSINRNIDKLERDIKLDSLSSDSIDKEMIKYIIIKDSLNKERDEKINSISNLSIDSLISEWTRRNERR